MASRREERKGNNNHLLVVAAAVGAAGLALGWAASELLKPGRREEARDRSGRSDRSMVQAKVVDMEDPTVIVVKDARSVTQIEEDEIVEALDQGSLKDERDHKARKERNFNFRV